MKQLLNFLKPHLLTSFILFLAGSQAYAQVQPGIPKPRGPVDLSDTSNLVIFIILPILVIIGYFFWRKAMKKRKEEEDKQQ